MLAFAFTFAVGVGLFVTHMQRLRCRLSSVIAGLQENDELLHVDVADELLHSRSLVESGRRQISCWYVHGLKRISESAFIVAYLTDSDRHVFIDTIAK